MNSKDDCNLKAAANRIREDNSEADRIGAMFANLLRLKRDTEKRDLWQTAWGAKTNIGLARCIIIALEIEGESYINPKK